MVGSFSAYPHPHAVSLELWVFFPELCVFHVCVLFLSSTPQPMQYAQELARKKRKATKEVYVHVCALDYVHAG